jgi:phosphate transport system substrate-binding protein
VTVGVAGTGGGLRRFCRGDLDMANASRPMSRTEAAACAAAGVTFLEVPVAYDGITVAVHPSNTWVDSLTIAELRRLWRHEAEGRLLRWSQLRPGFPDREVHLFGAGVDSGTFDYFTGVVTGAPRDSRGDYTSSEDDNMLVQGVAADPNALGYFGYAYYEAHRDSLRAVPIRADDTAPAVLPTPETIRSGAYHPLSRPVFVYVNVRALEREAFKAFLDYYEAHIVDLARDVGYVPLDARVQDAVRARVVSRTTGSLFVEDRHGAAATLAVRLGLE